MSKRFSYKKHGAWVKRKGTTREGRIAYFDRKTGLVWVVWEMGKYRDNGHTHKTKQPSAEGCEPKDLLLMGQYELSPWFDSTVKERS